ncbi:MAG: fumarylacetoacetate hydrolase family protein [Myxococcota bacterium]|nr:fumarylacetoacetate hydrolase family protein [Myxococcota bacterium]
MRLLALITISLIVFGLSLGLYLFRPFLVYPEPAELSCLDPQQGYLEVLGPPGEVYGLGLSYAGHIKESPGLYDPGAGLLTFPKRAHAVNRGDEIAYPSRDDLLQGVRNLDPLHAEVLEKEFPEIPALLDYEVEVGLQIREDILLSDLERSDFVPPVGYFVANDVTARILIGMAPEFGATVAYLAEGKGLAGFLPVGDRVWVPAQAGPDAWLCVELKTEVNGELRQQASSADIIVGPREILAGVAQAFDLTGFQAGDWVITGTPPGVASQVPGWIQRALSLVDPSAEIKLDFMIRSAGSDPAYLRPGDEVTVSAGILGSKTSRIVR